MTLEKLWDVLEALEQGEARAECECGAVSPDVEFCRICGGRVPARVGGTPGSAGA